MTTPDILTNIVSSIHAKQKKEFEKFENSDWEKTKRVKPVNVINAMKEKDFFLIAEVKKGSPSKGVFIENYDPVSIAKEYELGGASAISVITEEQFFFGKKEHICQVKSNVTVPVLRKDFIVHISQVYQSYNMGADMILLICSCLNDKMLHTFFSHAVGLELTVVVEVHNKDEAKRALKLQGDFIMGINNRNLKTFEVDLNTSFRIKEIVPNNIPLISESGISSNKEIMELKNAGFKGALVGESLIKSGNRAGRIRELLRA